MSVSGVIGVPWRGVGGNVSAGVELHSWCWSYWDSVRVCCDPVCARSSADPGVISWLREECSVQEYDK